MIEPANAQTLTRPGRNSSQGRTTCSSSRQQRQLWRNMSRVKRAVYQDGHVWGHILLPAPELPPPTNWGWSRTGEGQYTPYWTRLPEAAYSCIELVSSCKCKKGCARLCKCKKAALQCTALCVCERYCNEELKMSQQHTCTCTKAEFVNMTLFTRYTGTHSFSTGI